MKRASGARQGGEGGCALLARPGAPTGLRLLLWALSGAHSSFTPLPFTLRYLPPALALSPARSAPALARAALGAWTWCRCWPRAACLR
jgi:hypothetical protein